MKLKFYTLIASAILLAAFTCPAGAYLIQYDDFNNFESSFDNDPCILAEEKFGDGDFTLGGEFIIDFSTRPNTAFGVYFDTDAEYKVYLDSGARYEFEIEVGSTPQFSGVRTSEGDFINFVKMDLERGGRIGGFYHNEPSPAPEPATVLLLGSGLIGFGVLGRKKFFKKR